MTVFAIKEPDIQVPADEKTLMHVFGLSPMEARFLQAMLVRDWVGRRELPEVKYSIRQVIYTLRMKLEGKGIIIINDAAGRYSIPPRSKEVARGRIEEALALGGTP